MTANTFGELLRKYRIAAGFSQEQLAGEALISVESVGALERGTRRAPYRDTVAQLASALGLGNQERADLESAANRARARAVQRSGVEPEGSPSRRLPLQPTSLVGRTQDIAVVSALLEENRLVTITGSGGVGKTRAAIAVASHLPTARFGDIRFVDLSPLGDGTFIGRAIASSLHTSLGDAATTIENLTASLRSSRVLFVLDNCEHLIGDVALVVSAIVRSCEHVSFLATSRERLAIDGETVYRLPSLDVPAQSPTTIDRARAFAGLDLFIQRATSFDRTIAFADSAAEGIGEICRRLDGIPLAIELAAARASTLGVDALRKRLRNGLALTGGSRNLPARQQTMLATIMWSYGLLENDERSLLQRLSMFVQGFTLAAAESVCADEELEAHRVGDLLASLADKSLVNVVLSENSARYTLLESVRSFAHERLAERGMLPVFSRRHAEWVAAFADRIDAFRAQMSDRRLRIEVDPELENARAALTWALDTQAGADAVTAGRIVGGLRTIWLTSGRRRECARWAQAALDLIDGERHPHVAARLLRALIQATRGDESSAWAERAIPVFERIGDCIGIALLHSHLSANHCRRGRLAEADAAIARAGAMFQPGLTQRSMPYAAFLQNRTLVRLDQGRYAEALSDVSEGTAIVKALGDEDAFHWELSRAEVEFAMAHHEKAIRLTEDVIARALSRPSGHERELIAGYNNLAVFKVACGDIEGAYNAARESFKLARARSFDEFVSDTLDTMALVAASRSQARVAARLRGAMDAYCERSNSDTPTLGGNATKHGRELLRASLRRQLSLEEIDTLASEGATYTIDVAVAEASRL